MGRFAIAGCGLAIVAVALAIAALVTGSPLLAAAGAAAVVGAAGASAASAVTARPAPVPEPVEEWEDPRPGLVDRYTGLFDGRYFQAAFDARVATARRQLHPVTLVLIGVEGDEPPATFAETLRDTLRDSDTACHLGDGTFAVILEDTPESGGVWAAERVRIALARRGGLVTRLSAGVASYPSHALEAPDLVARAERALAHARTSARSHVEVASAD